MIITSDHGRKVTSNWGDYVELLKHVHAELGFNNIQISRDAWETGDSALPVEAVPVVSPEPRAKRFWAGGHDWSSGSQLGYNVEHSNYIAPRLVKLFDEIEVGDEITIKGCNMKKDLTIYALGRVTSVGKQDRIVKFEPISNRGELYHAKAPKEEGAGTVNYPSSKSNARKTFA